MEKMGQSSCNDLLPSLRSLPSSLGILQGVVHILVFVKSPFFFFQKGRGSLSSNYSVWKDSSAAFMLVNFILPVTAPYSLDFLIPQNLLSWNQIPLYSCIVRTYILLFSMWVVDEHGKPFSLLVNYLPIMIVFVPPPPYCKKRHALLFLFSNLDSLKVIKMLAYHEVKIFFIYNQNAIRILSLQFNSSINTFTRRIRPELPNMGSNFTFNQSCNEMHLV